jgi:hypothetical protein
MTEIKAFIMSWVIALFPALDPDHPPAIRVMSKPSTCI